MIRLGEINNLKVIRKSNLGYMLSDGNQEVLLHFNQADSEYELDDMVSAFIYSDKSKRPTASALKPLCTITEPGFVEVVDVLPGIGVFVNINSPKDILVSKDYLPFDEKKWPIVSDKLFINLKIKKDILVGKPLNRFDIVALHKEINYAEREVVDGYVCRIADKGIGIVTADMMYVYVPNTQLRGIYRMGGKVNVTITKRINDEYYGTLNALKEELIDTDKEIILNFLKNNNGVMYLTAKSSSEEVESLLRMSRKAFKRAYGALYKERIIDFDDKKTFLL